MQTKRACVAMLGAAAVLGGCGGGGSSGSGSIGSKTSGAIGVAHGRGSSTGRSLTSTSTNATTSSSSATATIPRSATATTVHGVRIAGTPSTEITNFGKAAGESELAVVRKTIKTYYADLAADRGAAACALLGPRIHHSIERSLGGTRLGHGQGGCTGIMAMVFRHHPGRPSTLPTLVAVTGMRVSGDRGYALISTKQRPSSEIRIERDHGVWKMAALIGSPLA